MEDESSHSSDSQELSTSSDTSDYESENETHDNYVLKNELHKHNTFLQLYKVIVLRIREVEEERGGVYLSFTC